MRVVVLGAGGHARVVLALLTSAKSYEVVAVLDDDAAKWGSSLDGISISGPIDAVADVPHDLAVIAVGDNRQRREISQRVQVRWATLIHPHSWVEKGVEIGEGSVVLAGSVVQPGSQIGAHVVLNSGVIVDHDCTVAAFSHLAPGVAVAGSVAIGEGVLMGVGSAAVPGASIGSWSRVGAGAVVVTDIPAGVDAVGVPARVVVMVKPFTKARRRCWIRADIGFRESGA